MHFFGCVLSFLYLLIGSFVLWVGVLCSVVRWDFFGESCYWALSHFLFYLLLCRCRCLFFLIPWCNVCSIYLWYSGVLLCVIYGSLYIIIFQHNFHCIRMSMVRWTFFILHHLLMVHCTFWFTDGCLVVAYYCVEVSFVAFV